VQSSHARWTLFASIVGTLILCGCATTTLSVDAAGEVRATELAFAKTMADRDFHAFQHFLSKDAVFFGDTSVAHGIDQISAVWKPFFAKPAAPFSWAPDKVEVLASGDLALSTGPVYVGGKLVGRFNSIWRRDAPGTWRIVFDKGESVCASEKTDTRT
jgi:ketosteroid isomerase-like protein